MEDEPRAGYVHDQAIWDKVCQLGHLGHFSLNDVFLYDVLDLARSYGL
jgi:hypothetical protein